MHSRVPASTLPTHSSLFPGNQTQLLPGRLLSSVRPLLRGTGVPHHSPPSQVLSRPHCQYLACAWCPSLGENLVTPGELPNFWGAQNLLDLCICLPCYLMENTRACNAQHLGSALLRELQSPSLGKGPLYTDCPGGCGCIPLLALLLFRFGLHPVFPHIVLLALFLFILRTFSRFRMPRQRLWAQ